MRITDITDDGYVSSPLPTSIDPNAYPNWRQYLLKEGDIVFARTGNSTGRNYYCSELNGQVVYAGFLIKFSISSPDVLPRFVGYYCQSESYWKQVRSRFTGSTRANLNAEQYGELEIPVVSLEKQRHIVDAIGSIDDLIENYRHQCLEIDKEVRFFLRCEDSGGKPLGKRISFIKGKPAQKNGDDPLPYLNMEYMSGQSRLLSHGGVFASNQDVLMLMDGASSGSVFIGASGYVGSTFALIKHGQDINPHILYAVLKENEKLFRARTTGSAIPHTDKAFVASIMYPVLSDAVVKKIELLLKRKTSLKTLIKNLATDKRVLLDKYFSTNR